MRYTIKVQINDNDFLDIPASASSEHDVIRGVKQYLNSLYGYKERIKASQINSISYGITYHPDENGFDINAITDFNRIAKVVETDNEKTFYNIRGDILHRIKYKERPLVYIIHNFGDKESIFEEFLYI